MEEVERQIREDTYGALKPREARLKERHDLHVQRREQDEARRLAQLRLLEQVRANATTRSKRCFKLCRLLVGYWLATPINMI
jgi:hypothetical protein